MQHQHPDDRFALTDKERDEFRRIWGVLASGDSGPALVDTEATGATHPGWSATAIVCLVFVFIGLAADSVFLVAFAAAGAVGALVATRRNR